MNSKYTPGTNPDEIPDELTPTGRTARQNIIIEEAAQRSVAEAPQWLLARDCKSEGCNDSRERLIELGFKIVSEPDELFYETIPPLGWSKTTSGFWTTICDETGKERISQFFKGAFYDRRAFLFFIGE